MVGYVLAYLATWRHLIRNSDGRRNYKRHFLTTHTFVDIVIAVANFVLYVKLLRDGIASGDVQYAGVEAVRLLWTMLLQALRRVRPPGQTPDEVARCRQQHGRCTGLLQ